MKTRLDSSDYVENEMCSERSCLETVTVMAEVFGLIVYLCYRHVKSYQHFITAVH